MKNNKASFSSLLSKKIKWKLQKKKKLIGNRIDKRIDS